jgi:hypothetical protein
VKGRTFEADAGDQGSPFRHGVIIAVGLQRLTTSGEFNPIYLHLAKQEVL